jgi:hypothetical protein
MPLKDAMSAVLVFVTKYRDRIFENAIQRLRAIFSKVCLILHAATGKAYFGRRLISLLVAGALR